MSTHRLPHRVPKLQVSSCVKFVMVLVSLSSAENADNATTTTASTTVAPLAEKEGLRLLFPSRLAIYEYNMQSRAAIVRAAGMTNAIAVDFDWLEKCLYWTDVDTEQGSTIKRVCGNERQYQTLHTGKTLKHPDGIAVDWAGRNLYWSDRKTDTIEVSKLDGQHRKVVMNLGLLEPRGLALDPARGYLYWTDWGDAPHIGKVGMDGSEPRTIVESSLGWPNALTISYETDELFWADALKDYIAVCDLNGGNVRVILSRSANPAAGLHHTFGLTVFGDYLYWTDWETTSVEKGHKYTGLEREMIFNTNQTRTPFKPMDIKAYHPLRQKPVANNPCSDKNGGCEALCLLKPGGGRTCACPENHYLAADGLSCNHVSCASLNCLNGGLCRPNNSPKSKFRGEFYCSCPAGYSGDRCELSLCDDHCSVEGKCQLNGIGQPQCVCAPGFTGDRCDKPDEQSQTEGAVKCSAPVECETQRSAADCSGPITAVVVLVVLVIVSLGAAAVYFVSRHRTKSSIHVRMQRVDKMEMSNPTYLGQQADESSELDSRNIFDKLIPERRFKDESKC